jgi:hypothetical protein
MRGSLESDDSSAILNFWKPGVLFNFGYAQLPGPTLRIRFGGSTPKLGIEIAVKDSDRHEARFRCSPPDRKVHDYFLPRSVLDERGVDLERVQLVALGPSTKADSPMGRFGLNFYGMVSTQNTADLILCDGLSKLPERPLPPNPDQPPGPTTTSGRPKEPIVHAASARFSEQVANARALLHNQQYGQACRAFETAIEMRPQIAVMEREEVSKARTEYEKNNFTESARHFEEAFRAIEGRQP